MWQNVLRFSQVKSSDPDFINLTSLHQKCTVKLRKHSIDFFLWLSRFPGKYNLECVIQISVKFNLPPYKRFNLASLKILTINEETKSFKLLIKSAIK